MLKRDYVMRKGNDRFRGFAVDLIHEVAKMLGFQYEIHLVADGNFGSKQEDGEWNGMIGELLAGVSPGEVLGDAVQCNTTGYNKQNAMRYSESNYKTQLKDGGLSLIHI